MAENDSTKNDACASIKHHGTIKLLREVALVAAALNPHAQAMAHARATKLTPERRSEIASKAAKTRWAKKKKKQK